MDVSNADHPVIVGVLFEGLGRLVKLVELSAYDSLSPCPLEWEVDITGPRLITSPRRLSMRRDIIVTEMLM